MNKPKRYNKRYLPMLWIGLVLWLLSMLISFIMEKTGNAPAGQESLMEMGKEIFQFMPIGVVLLFCLFQPILEELSFRLWGVGKKWMTIVCLILMTLFSVSEMGLWGLLFVGLFIVVWIVVKDKVLQNWINAIITSACFALCHVSGFDGFSIGMVLGLTDIFGMALVMCWLTINISFWLSCLLHVLNNSLAILIPLLFLSESVTVNTDGTTFSMESLKPFADNSALISDAPSLNSLDSTTTEFYLVGEPAEIASLLAARLDSTPNVYYDWASKGESLEERVVLRVKYDQPHQPDLAELLNVFSSMAKTFSKDEGFTYDTTTTQLKEIWKLYPDGNAEEVSTYDDPAISRVEKSSILGRGNTVIQESSLASDSSIVTKFYCLERKNPLAEQIGSMEALTDQAYGFSIDLRPAKDVRLITVK